MNRRSDSFYCATLFVDGKGMVQAHFKIFSLSIFVLTCGPMLFSSTVYYFSHMTYMHFCDQIRSTLGAYFFLFFSLLSFSFTLATPIPTSHSHTHTQTSHTLRSMSLFTPISSSSPSSSQLLPPSRILVNLLRPKCFCGFTSVSLYPESPSSSSSVRKTNWVYECHFTPNQIGMVKLEPCEDCEDGRERVLARTSFKGVKKRSLSFVARWRGGGTVG